MAFNSKRYTRHFGGAMMVYSVVCLAALSALGRYEFEPLVAAAVALSPVLPMLYALRAFIVEFRSVDEFHRRVQSEAIIWGAGLTGFGTFAYGFAELAIELPSVPTLMILPVMIMLYGFSSIVLYRSLK